MKQQWNTPEGWGILQNSGGCGVNGSALEKKRTKKPTMLTLYKQKWNLSWVEDASICGVWPQFYPWFNSACHLLATVKRLHMHNEVGVLPHPLHIVLCHAWPGPLKLAVFRKVKKNKARFYNVFIHHVNKLQLGERYWDISHQQIKGNPKHVNSKENPTEFNRVYSLVNAFRTVPLIF